MSNGRPPAVVRRLEVEERNNRYLGRLQAVEPPDLHVRVVDVGQGLCVVGLTAEGYTFLVDAGHWIGNACADGVDRLLPDMGLSMVVLTHSDGDHLGNLPLILVIEGGRHTTVDWLHAAALHARRRLRMHHLLQCTGGNRRGRSGSVIRPQPENNAARIWPGV